MDLELKPADSSALKRGVGNKGNGGDIPTCSSPLLQKESNGNGFRSYREKSNPLKQIFVFVTEKTIKKKRQESIDVLRGFTVWGLTLFLSSPGQKFELLSHPSWDGLTIADFGLPFFLWIMGYCSAIVLSRPLPPEGSEKIDSDKILWLFKVKNVDPRKYNSFKRWVKIFQRGFVLIFMGILIEFLGRLLDSVVFGERFKIRIFGVLQRLGTCFLVVAVIQNTFSWIWTQIVIILIIHMIYNLLMFGIPYKSLGNDCFAGNLSKDCNAETFFCVKLFGLNGPDAEGPVTNLNAIVVCYMGAVYHHIFKYCKKKSYDDYRLLTFWMLLSSVFLSVGVILNWIWAPFNKRLFSTSYLLVTGSTCGLLLSGFYYVVDVLKIVKPFLIWTVFGSNALITFVLIGMVIYYPLFEGIPVNSEMKLGRWIAHYVFQSWTKSEEWSGVIFGFCYTSFFVPILWILWKYNIIIRV